MRVHVAVLYILYMLFMQRFRVVYHSEIVQTVTLNVYFVSIRLICFLLISSDFRSAVVYCILVVSLLTLLLGKVLNMFFVPTQKLAQHYRHVCNAVELK